MDHGQQGTRTPGRVLVYGAYGHTGRFVIAELLRRGHEPLLSGRDPARLAALGAAHPGLETRAAAVEDTASLQNAMTGVAAVINCAGPFLDTAREVAAAAVRAGAHYLDVTAEQPAVRATYDEHADSARAAGVAVVPAMAFYGGLADLLATAALGDWASADEISVAFGLDRWWPTEGTRTTGRRNTARRLVVTGGRLAPLPDPPPERSWEFPGEFGTQDVVGVPFSEIITMARHLRAAEIHSYINLAPMRDIRDPGTPPSEAADESGRSSQRFVVDVAVRKGTSLRRMSAAGRDIYAVTAPLVCEAVTRLLDGRSGRTGVAAPGEAFDAADFLDALSPGTLLVQRR
ncbi:saccharopine dehydrogenase family protein [Thermomonospora cellulosilytica]|uniref:Short subunit dehydrogenase-like uncharacterized protein n=1 Tax=Thermomonospora cellulosilytica TaxID=1411118 RepID=A0A7W3MTC4_9ACTN|nr:saccharopine dehydrogenase NADP-binding domain-containing protein [Thermomonospora cellulosilytica]MBA9001542.1 short subunit dehydrogenase-like uncharacterized protein [Thermomonospora cellulosilytica]